MNLMDLISTHDEDEMWVHFGSRERYRAEMVRRAYDAAVQRRKQAEAVVAGWEAEVARTSGAYDNGEFGQVPWGDAGTDRYARELAAAKARLDDARREEQELEREWKAADAIARPKPPSDEQRRLDSAQRSLAEAEKRAAEVDAKLAAARDALVELKAERPPKGTVDAARRTVAIDDAEKEVERLETAQEREARNVEWHRRWVDVKQAEVDGASPGETLAAIDALNAVTEEGAEIPVVTAHEASEEET